MKKLTLTISSNKRPTDPLEIFNKTTLRGRIENIWEPQAEALKEWHSSYRTAPDIVVQMNTGGGKTLVGLLMAQSLANEKKGQVLYVCANNQLIEQTQQRAEEIGLSPAMRYRGEWKNQVNFDMGETFCLTNYHVIFNGRSIFRNSDINAVVFDDAHVAEGTIRSCFTVTIPRDHKMFSEILSIFRPHFANSSQATHFTQIAEGGFTTVLFVPMFIVWRHYEEVRKKLVENGVAENIETKFSWDHIKEHLNHCCILMTSAGIEITPVSLPLSTLPYFGPEVRRIYLTATLPSQTSFARTFGVAKPTVICPTGKSGDAQRLFVFTLGKDDDAQRESAKELVKNRKCCVISPSRKKAEQWVPPAQIYDTESGQAEIDRFRQSDSPEMLALVARYDGIDLPGKSCRVLILDRLPAGENLIDRFIDEGIKVEAIRQSHTATRVVQAIGRIFRSNTDHGVVILVGQDLQSWLRHPKYQGYLPPLLQQQIQLAGELRKAIEKDETNWLELMEGVLTGDENWDATYKAYISKFDTATVIPGAQWYVQLIPQERKAYEELWSGQPGKAADLYGQLATEAAKNDARLVAWYRHLRGMALLCGNQRSQSLYEFIQAANIRAELGRPSEEMDKAFRPNPATAIGPQAQALAAWYQTKKAGFIAAFAKVESELVYGDDTSKAEEALKLLGTLLGLQTERPDNEKKVGPDVMWKSEVGISAWGFELKTGKKDGSEYTKVTVHGVKKPRFCFKNGGKTSQCSTIFRQTFVFGSKTAITRERLHTKDEIGQCHNHEERMKNTHGTNIELAIVGRMLRVSRQADPFPGLRVIELEALRDLWGRAKKVFDSVDGGDKSDLTQSFQTWINHYGLIWPVCVESLPNQLATDLRDKT